MTENIQNDRDTMHLITDECNRIILNLLFYVRKATQCCFNTASGKKQNELQKQLSNMSIPSEYLLKN